MSEYWKSNAKKYCDYCKTWISDNKSSIAIHEGGKNHKEKVQDYLKSIKKRNDQKHSDEKKYNKELAAIERAAMAAMDKDLESNPSLKRQYNSTDKNQPVSMISLVEASEKEKEKEKQVKKEKSKDKAKPVAVAEPTKRKAEPEQTPEQQSRIGKWESVDAPVKIVEEVVEYTFESVNLGLPTSSGFTSKFNPLSITELTTELDKADVEFKSKGINSIRPTQKIQNKGSISTASEFSTQNNQIKTNPENKWKAVTENSGFKEVNGDEETNEILESISYTEDRQVKVEPSEETNIEIEPTENQVNSDTVVNVKKERITEKVVTLGSSNRKQKNISFKKRKTDSSNFRERQNDD